MQIIYNLLGREVVPASDHLIWALGVEKCRRTIGRTKIGAILVSTVFLGIDHGWSGSPFPVVFETMIFAPQGEAVVARFSDYEEAEEGHQQICRQVLAWKAEDENIFDSLLSD